MEYNSESTAKFVYRDARDIGEALVSFLDDLNAGIYTQRELDDWLGFLNHAAAAGKSYAIPKRNIKDSLFCNYFSYPKHVLALSHDLYPDTIITLKDIEILTIHRVLTNGTYNDLGFQIGDRLIVLVEAQSTWSVNILIRAMDYITYTYKRYLWRSRQNTNNTTKVHLPKVDFYIVYTGKPLDFPTQISLEREFEIEGNAMEIRARVITLTDEMTVLNQYILACKTLDKHLLAAKTEQDRALALKAAVYECIAKGYLKEYFEEHLEEVLAMLAQYYRDIDFIEAGRLIELEDARNEGIDIGMVQGIDIGKAQGIDIGMVQNQESTILHLLYNKKMPVTAVVDLMDYPQELVARVAREHNIPI